MKHFYNKKQLVLSSYYNTLFLKKFEIYFFDSNAMCIKLPIFTKRLQRFILLGTIRKTSKKQ